MVTREQLEAVLRAKSGNLHDTRYPILLLALAVNEKSAVLSLSRNQLHKEVIFDVGAPVDCRSNIATESLARFLVATGKLREEDYRSAFALSASRGVPFEEILTERKLVAPTELYRLLQQSLGRKLLEPFSWTSGTYQISFDVPEVDSALRVKVPQLILTGILKIEPQESADEAVARGKYVALGDDPLFSLDDFRLTSDQQQIVDAARRGASLEEIRAASGVAEDDLNRMLYALLLLGVIALTEERMMAVPHFELDHPFQEKTVEKPAPAPPPPPRPPVTAAAKRPTEAAGDEVIATYLAYRRKDAFDLLGVNETDGPIEFRRAYLRLAEKFQPWQFEEKTADGLREKAQDVFLAIARAYGELADPERRESLQRSRQQKRTQAAAAPPTVKPITAERPLGKENLIDPEALCRNGRELVASGKLREALSSFEMAAECDAQNGTYAAEVAWTRFQLMSTPASSALKLLKNALRIDPRSGVAYLYAGKVLTALGNRAEAENYLNRAAMLMPRDLRVAEALKALR